MSKTLIILILISLQLISCGDKKPKIDLKEKQSEILDNIKTTFNAEDIKLDKVKSLDSDKIIENSILIDVLNSSVISIDDPNLKGYCENVLVEFVKSCDKESNYDIIEIRFSEGKDIKIYHKWDSKGFTYSKSTIDNIKVQLNSPRYLLEQAYLKCEKQENYDSLIIFANSILSENPSLNIAIKFRGLGYYKLNELEKAENDFLKAWSLDKSDIDNPMNLAILYGDKKEYQIGLQYIDTVLIMHPDYPKAIYFRGIYKFRLGDKKNSLIDLQHAGQLGVSDATTFLQFEFKE